MISIIFDKDMFILIVLILFDILFDNEDGFRFYSLMKADLVFIYEEPVDK